MPVTITAEAFSPWTAVAEHQTRCFAQTGKFGATAVFVGTMRDANDGDAVRGMTLEHYPGMTELHLAEICETAERRWPLLTTLVVHRVGHMLPGEPIVLVAVWSEHRADAFAACRFIMEDLKARAPFWKKEETASGERWVTSNTPASLDE